MKTKSKLLGLVIKVLLEKEKCFLCYSTFGAILKSGCRGTHTLPNALTESTPLPNPKPQTPNPKQVVNKSASVT